MFFFKKGMTKMKKIINRILVLVCMLALGACALTPEQKAAQAKAREEERLQMQLSLASQCDPATAQLMAKLPSSWDLPKAQKEAFDQEYESKINNPVFQACYKMAWQAYVAQARLEQARYHEMMMDDMYWNRPFGCQRWSNGRPYWFGC